MKLSMSILAWELREFKPDIHIVSDAMLLQGVRFLGISDTFRSQEYVYFGRMADYFPDAGNNSYICMNRDSYILLEDCPMEHVLNAILSAFDFFNNWEQRLSRLAEEHAPAAEMMALRSEILPDPYCIEGIDNSVVAISDDGPDNLRTQWEEIRMSGMGAGISKETVYDANNVPLHDFSFHTTFIRRLSPNSLDMFATYLRQENERIAGLVTWYKTKAPEAMQLQINDVLVQYLPQAREFTSDESNLKARPTLLADILSGKKLPEAVLKSFESAQLLRWYRVLVFSGRGRKDLFRRNFVQAQLRRMPEDCIPFSFEGRLLTLVRENDNSAFMQKLSDRLPLDDISVGVSTPVNGLAHLGMAYHQAVFCLESSDNAPGVHFCKDYAFSFLMDRLTETDTAVMLLHPAIHVLEVYDTENNGELCATLQAYLRCNMNLTDTAELMHIHRNTMKYRLSRICELTDIEFMNPEERCYLNVSFYIREHMERNKEKTGQQQ